MKNKLEMERLNFISVLMADKLKIVPAADIFDTDMFLEPSQAERTLSRYFPLVDTSRQYKWTTDKKRKM